MVKIIPITICVFWTTCIVVDFGSSSILLLVLLNLLLRVIYKPKFVGGMYVLEAQKTSKCSVSTVSGIRWKDHWLHPLWNMNYGTSNTWNAWLRSRQKWMWSSFLHITEQIMKFEALVCAGSLGMKSVTKYSASMHVRTWDTDTETHGKEQFDCFTRRKKRAKEKTK